MESDLVIGIGGIYSNHTAGFGGGSQLALGVLGIRSIYRLHYHHDMVRWGSDKIKNNFRRDLDEIASMIRMNTVISLLINADRDIIQMDCGDHRMFFHEAVNFYRKTFTAPLPNDADVIISNIYPNDLSLTFARMKGFVPLNCCKFSASRIAIASCSEGLGLHNIFPFVNIPRFHQPRHIMRRISTMATGERFSKIINELHRKMRPSINKPKKCS
ncbi:MAG: hypothetical protein ACE5HX_16250 [bacterium]